ncbi:hypothetical protein B296_00010597 [Ensete ventricosum]|uniref:Uncharacterized protein n=1 Tax=Ensete ventricosum TaxID=4639 RepID=A0A426YUP1_ENSVE|nr:hypothetical protein B296_00010597 [Ensete ventricosum]
MALKLSSQLPLSLQKSHKGSQRWPMPHPIPPPNLAGCGCSLLPSGVTSLSRRSGGRGVVHAVKEEETLPPALAEADASKTPSSSSSKLVLVVGGTGGVAFPSKRWNGDNTPERIGRNCGLSASHIFI